jgi:hypothetical protein
MATTTTRPNCFAAAGARHRPIGTQSASGFSFTLVAASLELARQIEAASVIIHNASPAPGVIPRAPRTTEILFAGNAGP